MGREEKRILADFRKEGLGGAVWEDRQKAERKRMGGQRYRPENIVQGGPEPCPEDAAMMHVGTGQGK